MVPHHKNTSGRKSRSLGHLTSLSLLVVVVATVVLSSLANETMAQNCLNLIMLGPGGRAGRFEWTLEDDVLDGTVYFPKDNLLDAGWIAVGLGTNLAYGMAPADILLVWKNETGVIKHAQKQAVALVGRPQPANGIIYESEVIVEEHAADKEVVVHFMKRMQYDNVTGSITLTRDTPMVILVAMHMDRTPRGEDGSENWFTHQYNRKYQFTPNQETNTCPSPQNSTLPSDSEPSTEPSIDQSTDSSVQPPAPHASVSVRLPPVQASQEPRETNDSNSLLNYASILIAFTILIIVIVNAAFMYL